jgi:molybdate transport system substrate-binding protein
VEPRRRTRFGRAQATLTASDTINIAIANPELAPYGVAAKQTLERLGLWETVQPKIVFGQNIGQAHALVDTGAAQMGFVALSAVVGPEGNAKGSRWDVPQEYFDPIQQDAVLLSHGGSNAAAIAFLDFLKGDEAGKIVASFGYDSD